MKQKESKTDKSAFLLIHGYKVNVGSVFFPWLKRRLESFGYKVQSPELPNPDRPVESEQVEYVIQNCTIDNNTVIFGHSLGAVVAIKVLLKIGKPVAGLVLAATSIDPKFPGVKKRPYWDNFSWDFDYGQIKKLAGLRVIISVLRESDEAKFEKLRVAYLRELACKIEAKLIEVTSSQEHFTDDEEPLILSSILQEFN